MWHENRISILTNPKQKKRMRRRPTIIKSSWPAAAHVSLMRVISTNVLKLFAVYNLSGGYSFLVLQPLPLNQHPNYFMWSLGMEATQDTIVTYFMFTEGRKGAGCTRRHLSFVRHIYTCCRLSSASLPKQHRWYLVDKLYVRQTVNSCATAKRL